MDVNEYAVEGKLAKQMKMLSLNEAYCTKFNPTDGLVSYSRGRYQIDSTWYLRNVVLTTISICPFDFGAGDHRPHVIDIHLTSVLGELAAPSVNLTGGG